MLENEKNNEKQLNTTNIFDEFDVTEEEQKQEELNKKDLFFFLNTIWNFFKYINLVLLIFILFAGIYLYIQKSDWELMDNKDYLNPICSILTWWEEIFNWENCSSITILNKKIDDKIKKLKEEEFKLITKTLINNFELYNTSNSQEALFLLDKTKNKNNPYKILEEFESLKSEFSWLNPTKLQCKNISINKNNLSIKCSTFSEWLWQWDIPWFNWELSVNKIHWTTRTMASSFINFIEKSNKFIVKNKPKSFSIKPYFWEFSYSYKTDFTLELELNKQNNKLY